ncbi:MAG TPA: DUF3179 domain-containing protein [Longimicrobiales bacterium]|nr:DUF3179 domain-containing protein [Longimicrobiales bacterium]
MSAPQKILVIAPVVALVLVGISRLGSASGAEPDPTLPLAETPYVLGDGIDDYIDFMMSGGPPPDGIPSIDRPRFVSAGDAKLDGGDIVIGFHHEGEARAYPQRILVQHEIVNDRVGGLNVVITYCPLTATAQGFKRGDTTLGVSGQLLNSNLVMFDRDSGTLFSQIAATGLTGEHRGRTLDEMNVTWTTWERWSAAYPRTRVLSERTGHLRNYARDPYGRYNPVGGYYARAGTIFPLMHTSSEHHDKKMVVGGRTSERAAYFVLEELARDRVQSTANFLAVYDQSLDTGYVYATDADGPRVSPRGDGTYEIDGETYAPDALPLERLVPVEAFFFAWNAFYPDSESF